MVRAPRPLRPAAQDPRSVAPFNGCRAHGDADPRDRPGGLSCGVPPRRAHGGVRENASASPPWQRPIRRQRDVLGVCIQAGSAAAADELGISESTVRRSGPHPGASPRGPSLRGCWSPMHSRAGGSSARVSPPLTRSLPSEPCAAFVEPAAAGWTAGSPSRVGLRPHSSSEFSRHHATISPKPSSVASSTP